MIHWLWLLVAAFIGANVGMLIMGVLYLSRREPEPDSTSMKIVHDYFGCVKCAGEIIPDDEQLVDLLRRVRKQLGRKTLYAMTEYDAELQEEIDDALRRAGALAP